MAFLTAAAPLLVDLAERAFKALATEEPCTHTEAEKCDKDKHLRPTPIGALLLLGLIVVGMWGFQAVQSSSSRLELMEQDVKELKTDVGDIKNFLTFGKPLYHAATTPTPIPRIVPHIQLIPPASADPLDNVDMIP
jgi:hypothetical protein